MTSKETNCLYLSEMTFTDLFGYIILYLKIQISIQPPTSPAGLNQAGHMIPSSPHLGGGVLNQPDSDAGSAGINFDGRRKRLNSEGNYLYSTISN